MEKQRNKFLMRIINICLIILLPSLCVFSQQQDRTLNQKQYILGEVRLSGKHNIDKKSVLKLMNLSMGQKINIPGTEITDGVKQLWSQNMFSDIQVSMIEQDNKPLILDIYLVSSPSLLKYTFNGIKKGDEESIREKLDFYPGISITPNLIKTSKQIIENYFIEKGFLNSSCSISTQKDSMNSQKVILTFDIQKNNRLKIGNIEFTGNNNIKSSKLKKVMKGTRETGFRYLLSSSKLIDEKYEEDLINIISLYSQKGYRDARILNDSIYVNNDDRLIISIEIDEGEQYFFGDISWLGNTKYSSEDLAKILAIKKGDLFDQTLLDERLNMSRDGDDISALYMDDGYLFFQVNPVEMEITRDNMINLQMQMREGNQATINNVTIKGNTKTNDHVMIREIRSLPGELFKRSNIIRTQEELNRLGFFNPEALGVNPIPDPTTGNVDIEYVVEEKPADQVEMSGGFGNNMFVGQLSLTFNNFSTKGILDKSTWSPLPTGDGQKVQLSAQSYGLNYQNYRFLFQEPWLGGKKPNSFTTQFWHSIQRRESTDASGGQIDNILKMYGFSIGFGKRVQWPDDYFTIQNSFNINRYDPENWSIGTDGSLSGIVSGINLASTIKRNSIFNPIYPRSGSSFQLTMELTPPYSLFNNKDYSIMTDDEKFQLLEYYKFKTKGEWYTSISGNLVLKTLFEFGILGSYNTDIGIPPFERFYVGGDGLQGYAMDGREVIGVRGYPNYPDLLSKTQGMPIYSKYTMELRYPISLNPTTTIFALCFAEGANAWNSMNEFTPFEVKRSLGLGIRIFMPMFGMMGVDFGYGFDVLDHTGIKSGWQPQFTIGQQF